MAIHLTVAEVAAVINVSLVLGIIHQLLWLRELADADHVEAQATYPLMVAFVAVGILKNRVNAATWYDFDNGNLTKSVS